MANIDTDNEIKVKEYCFRFCSKFIIPFSIREDGVSINVKKFVKDLKSIKYKIIKEEHTSDNEKEHTSDNKESLKKNENSNLEKIKEIAVWEQQISDKNKNKRNIEEVRFILNPVQETLFYNDKFLYFHLNEELKESLFADRTLCVSTVRYKITNQVELKPQEFNINVELILCYTGIGFLVYSIESKKETPIDVILNLNYFFPKADEQVYVHIFLSKMLDKGLDIIPLDKKMYYMAKKNENIVSETLLTKLILGDLTHYIDRNNVEHRLYDRPIVYSYAVIKDDKILKPKTRYGGGFEASNRFLRGFSAILDHKSDVKQTDIGIVSIDEDSMVSLQMDFICFWINGWNMYNRTGLPSKIKNVYFYIFILILSQFFTLNFLSYYHHQAREKGKIKNIQEFLTSLRRYKMDLMFDVVSLNLNLKSFYEKLIETYEVKDLIKSTNENLSIDDKKISQKKDSIMNYLLAVLTFFGIPLGIITEMFDRLLFEIEEGFSVGSLIFGVAVILDIILIIFFLISRNRIKT